ncbi:MAG: hypothetical protein H6697_12765 [Myxococcales bacterium]|nr:hypothetical protein [Myxococcales bacterium]
MGVLMETGIRGPRGVLGALVLCVLGWGAVASWDEAADVAAAWAPRSQRVRPIDPSRPADSGPPGSTVADGLVARVRELGLRGGDWRPGEKDGRWTARLERTVGGMQVTCRLESSQADRVEHVEVELETYSYHVTDRGRALVDTFAAVIHVVAPHVSDALLERPVPWTDGAARLERLPETGSRDVLRFTLDVGVEGEG